MKSMQGNRKSKQKNPLRVKRRRIRREGWALRLLQRKLKNCKIFKFKIKSSTIKYMKKYLNHILIGVSAVALFASMFAYQKLFSVQDKVKKIDEIAGEVLKNHEERIMGIENFLKQAIQ